ncbi:MAG: PqqD family protein [Bacteroidales bacterium]|nr:PqqD family protein [Bacteroidales bacterium]
MKIKSNIAVSDSGFIFNPDTGESFTVNPLGASIISYIKEGKSVKDITGELRQVYEIDVNTLEKDTEDFLGLLKNFSLLTDA